MKKKQPPAALHGAYKPWIGVILAFAIWYAVSALGIVNTYILPSPGMCLKAFCKMVTSGELARDILISFGRVLRGFLIAFILAFLLGAFKVLLPSLAGFYENIILFFKNVPPLSMIPLLILWCGIRETTKTVIIVLASFFPMYLSIVKGFTGVDSGLIEVGKTFRYTPLKIFLRIILPSALSDILVGMRTGLGYAWRAIIGAEMIAASTGLGHLILFSQQTSRTDKVIVGIFVIGTVGYVTDRLFGFVIRRFFGGTARNGWD